MQDWTPEQQVRLESAYTKLSRDTGRVTVTALRTEAGLSQNVASAWLRGELTGLRAALAALKTEAKP